MLLVVECNVDDDNNTDDATMDVPKTLGILPLFVQLGTRFQTRLGRWAIGGPGN